MESSGSLQHEEHLLVREDYFADRDRVHQVCEALEGLLEERLAPGHEHSLNRAYRLVVRVCEDLSNTDKFKPNPKPTSR